MRQSVRASAGRVRAVVVRLVNVRLAKVRLAKVRLAMVGAACGIAAGAAMAQSAPQTADAPKRNATPLCVVRQLDQADVTVADGPRLAAWVTVPQPTYAYVTAAGTARARDLGHVALRVLRDGTMLAGSGDVAGTGMLDVKVESGGWLQPGRQYHFVVTPELHGAQMTRLRLSIGAAGCR